MEENKDNNPKDVKAAADLNVPEDDAEFENPSVDPGFETSHDEPDSLEDERGENIDVNKNISEMQRSKHDDALNYKNDRENGAYNPKNI
jgi:hypothetical protein